MLRSFLSDPEELESSASGFVVSAITFVPTITSAAAPPPPLAPAPAPAPEGAARMGRPARQGSACLLHDAVLCVCAVVC